MFLSLLLTLAFGQEITEEDGDPNAQGTVAWWKTSYPWHGDGVVAPASGGISYCDIADNDLFGFWPINYDCNAAGTCVVHNGFQSWQPLFTWGKCECANPATENNFVYLDTAWDFQLFEGDECTSVEFKLFGTISYLIKFTEWNPSGDTVQGRKDMFECYKGTGPGIEFDTTNPLEADAAWRTLPDMLPMVKAVIQYNQEWEGDDLAAHGYLNYDGLVVPYWASSVKSQHCRVCSAAYTCDIGGDTYGDGNNESDNQNPNGGWLKVSFATNYNTYYNHNCEKEQGVMPVDKDGYQAEPECPDNKDDGFSGQKAFQTAVFGTDGGTHHKEHFHELTRELRTEQVFPPGEHDHHDRRREESADLLVYGMGWDEMIQIQRTATTETAVKGTSTNSLRFPTRSPTLEPTDLPTPEPTSSVQTCFDLGYTHQIADLHFMGVAQAGQRGCRWGLDPAWPGGDEPLMCDSPYTVCLPQANTPNVGFPTDEGPDMYESDTTPYSVDMCKKECAYDQRCSGFEFWAEAGVGMEMTGKCTLLDDIPVDMGTSANPSVTSESDLSSMSYGDFSNSALCYEKTQPCNPYFGEDDLNEVMLTCYCPNNRKGFYTKNVVRTVEATHFCGYDGPDQAVTKRIREAQANRMFHLCENWCLFNTQSPRTESWYHDPWEECWREQYAGVGTHRSYCYRVIRDPFTIEQFFIDTRSNKMCDSSDADLGFGNNVNTPSPHYAIGDIDTAEWHLAEEEETCTSACDDEGMVCNNQDIMKVINGAGNIEGFMADAGYTCTTYAEAETVSPNGLHGWDDSHGWALPAVGPDGQCITRHPDANNQGDADGDLYVGCDVAIGVGYQRLCACGFVKVVD